MMANLAEEDIIKKRLLIEGDSGNDDRQINKCIKSFVKWATLTSRDANLESIDENSEVLLEQVTAGLSYVEFGLLRNHFIFEMNLLEQENYKVLYEKISKEIEKAEKKIVSSKQELIEARKIRKNRQEYDVLARQIQAYPDRAEMQTTIKNLEEKLEYLNKTELEYNKKLELRHKQFNVVLQSLSSLKCLIESDIKPCDMITTTDNRVNKESMIVENEDDMDDENAVVSSRERREKHYSTNEVEMEDAS